MGLAVGELQFGPELRIPAIALGESTYWEVGVYCHPEVVATATPAANRYP